jgi:hypothetical protein
VDPFPGAAGATLGRTFDGNFDTVLRLSSSFAEKRVLVDLTAGWHHEDHNTLPADGSRLGSSDPAALVNQPFVIWARMRSLTEFEDLPPAVVTDCLSDQNGGANRCRVTYSTGGPSVWIPSGTTRFRGPGSSPCSSRRSATTS